MTVSRQINDDNALKEKNMYDDQQNQEQDLIAASLAKRLEQHLAPLSLLERRFVLAYLKSGNQAQAAREAGYSHKSAKNQGSLLMRRQHVKAALDAAQAAMIEKTAYDVATAMAEFDEVIAFARQTKNATAMCRAVELRAKMAGLLDSPGEATGTPLNIHIDLGGVDDAPRQEARHARVIDADTIPESFPLSPIEPMAGNTSHPPGAFSFPRQFPELQPKGAIHEFD